MGRPFSDLEKRAFTILANGGDPAQSLDTELASYWAWRINPSLESHDLSAASTRITGRKLQETGINPFGMDLPANTFAKATLTKRTQDFITAPLKTALQHNDLAPTTTAYRLARFRPARVYARTGAADTPTERTSRITGRKYKTYYTQADEGYSMPYGQNADGDTDRQRQTAITAAIKTQDTTVDLISYSPEKLKA